MESSVLKKVLAAEAIPSVLKPKGMEFKYIFSISSLEKRVSSRRALTISLIFVATVCVRTGAASSLALSAMIRASCMVIVDAPLTLLLLVTF
jgi:hypothetical protein